MINKFGKWELNNQENVELLLKCVQEESSRKEMELISLTNLEIQENPSVVEDISETMDKLDELETSLKKLLKEMKEYVDIKGK